MKISTLILVLTFWGWGKAEDDIILLDRNIITESIPTKISVLSHDENFRVLPTINCAPKIEASPKNIRSASTATSHVIKNENDKVSDDDEDEEEEKSDGDKKKETKEEEEEKEEDDLVIKKKPKKKIRMRKIKSTRRYKTKTILKTVHPHPDEKMVSETAIIRETTQFLTAAHLETVKMAETTQIVNVPSINRVESRIDRNVESDIHDIWNQLESNNIKSEVKTKLESGTETREKDAMTKPMAKVTKKMKSKRRLKRRSGKKRKIRRRSKRATTKKEEKEKKITEERSRKRRPRMRNEMRKEIKSQNLIRQHFHTLPAKKRRKGCIKEQTVIIPPLPISVPAIPPPALTTIAIASIPVSSYNDIEKVHLHDMSYYKFITNYAGTATSTVTTISFIPVPTTSLKVATSTIFAPTTQVVYELVYTPYTVTTTSTDTAYMIKVTTVCKGRSGSGCNACELDVNGMVLPAGNLPPGIFATPVNEVDRNKFDIIGYAGMNTSNFNADLQGFKPALKV